MPAQKFHFPGESGLPSNTRFLGPTSGSPNDITIGSFIFAQLTSVPKTQNACCTSTQSDIYHTTGDMCGKQPHLYTACERCSPIIWSWYTDPGWMGCLLVTIFGTAGSSPITSQCTNHQTTAASSSEVRQTVAELIAERSITSQHMVRTPDDTKHIHVRRLCTQPSLL